MPGQLWRIYRSYLKTSLLLMLQYRAAMLIWMIGRVLEPLIYLVVWTAVAGDGERTVGGYSASGFATYFIAMMTVNQLTFTWIMWEYEHRIRHGSLSFLLLRPVHPLHADLADNLAYKVLTLAVLVPSVLVLGVLFGASWHPSPWALALFVPALLLAFLQRFILEWTLALAAFWTTRTLALNQLYFLVLVFLSGRLAPLSLFPEPARVVAKALPFYWMIGFPTELVLGQLSLSEALTGLAVQALGLVAACGLLRLVWRAGVRRYGAVGA